MWSILPIGNVVAGIGLLVAALVPASSIHADTNLHTLVFATAADGDVVDGDISPTQRDATVGPLSDSLSATAGSASSSVHVSLGYGYVKLESQSAVGDAVNFDKITGTAVQGI